MCLSKQCDRFFVCNKTACMCRPQSAKAMLHKLTEVKITTQSPMCDSRE